MLNLAHHEHERLLKSMGTISESHLASCVFTYLCKEYLLLGSYGTAHSDDSMERNLTILAWQAIKTKGSLTSSFYSLPLLKLFAA